jgi:hypothetical protein
MTVSELIEKLKTLPSDAPITVRVSDWVGADSSYTTVSEENGWVVIERVRY